MRGREDTARAQVGRASGTPLAGTPLAGTPLAGTPLAGTPLAGAAGRQLAGERLRQAILAGEMSHGQRLIEAELAEMIGVTRASQRTAGPFDLTAEGLAERIPNRGARVRTGTLDEAVAITECRMVLGGLCAAKAAERGTRSQAARLGQLGQQMQRSVADEEPLKYSALNHELAPTGQGNLRPKRGSLADRAAERAVGPAPVPAVAAPRPPAGLAGRTHDDHHRCHRTTARRGRASHAPPSPQRHESPHRSPSARKHRAADRRAGDHD